MNHGVEEGMGHRMSSWRPWAAVVLACGMLMSSSPAEAHWCTNIYRTPARIVVKPERDTVFISDTVGAVETLRVTVRNNFPYVVSNTILDGNNPNFDVSCDPYGVELQPGQERAFTLTITRTATGGDDNLYLRIVMDTHFPGWMDITSNYFTKALPTESEINSSNQAQAMHLMWQKFTELESTYPGAQGLDNILEAYGHPRLQYNSDGGYDGSWYPNEHYIDETDFYLGVWDQHNCQRGVMDMAIIHLSDTRVQEAYLDGMDDPMPVWRGMCAILAAAFTPGPSVTSRIQTMASTDNCVRAANCDNYPGSFTPSDDARVMAKAALVILGDTQYQAEVDAYARNSGNREWARYICAAGLGLAGLDAPVIDVVLPSSRDDAEVTSQFASYLMQVVASFRRGASGTGCVSFYGECPDDDVPPQAPANLIASAAP